MSATPTAVKQQPPSPPQSNDGDFDLSVVQQHMASLENEPLQIKPTGLAGQLTDQYGDPSYCQTAVNHVYYPSRPGFHQSNHPATPPTIGYDNVMQTRSGRSFGSLLKGIDAETSRKSRSPKPKTKRPPRNSKTTKPAVNLPEPLSVMTRDWVVPLADIEGKVHRSAEQRQVEINSKKNNGKVPRPMNSFMLYRSAYAERVKEYCKEGNHQIISQITGASWAREPPEIKELYEKYADIDRQNHQKAHPDYKFAPNKSGPASRKRKARDNDDDDLSDWEDRDCEASSTRTNRARYGQSAESRSQSSTPFETMGQPSFAAVPVGSVNASSYHASNPRSMPPVYPVNVDGHYYEQWVTPYRSNIEDIHLRRVQHPGTIPYGLMDDDSLVGLPQAQPLSGYGVPQPVHMNPLDPRLEQYGVHDPHVQYESVDPAHSFEPQYEFDQDEVFAAAQYAYPELSAHPGMATLTSPRAAWDQPLPGADFDEELGKWHG